MGHFATASIRDRVNADPTFRLAARYWNGRVQLVVGDERYLLTVVDGEVASFEAANESDTAFDVRVTGTADAWDRLLQPVPPPGAHNITVAPPLPGKVTVEGDLIASVGPYFPAIVELVNVMRVERNGGVPQRPVANVARKFDAAVGRYTYLDIDGVQYRVYFEESGTGDVPLLLQHTAGADGRQWRHVLEDPDYQRLFRMVAFDLPYHGKSLPPTSIPWWESEYRLTKDFLMKVVVGVSHALELDQPAFMGCSIGGHLAPDLALYYPDEFRAVVAINGGLKSVGTGRTEMLNSWYHPRVSNDFKAASMLGQTAPTSPAAYRRETTWIYSQGAPAALKGDVYYYSIDHDLTAEQARSIDTSKVDVYLLTGQYDFLAGDDGTAELARNIPGSYFRLLPGLGHFGPSENPEDFKAVLLPVLEAIARGDKPSSVPTGD